MSATESGTLDVKPKSIIVLGTITSSVVAISYCSGFRLDITDNEVFITLHVSFKFSDSPIATDP